MEFFAPRIHADAAAFWDGCRAHQLHFQQCCDCGALRWPASFLCPVCLSGRYTVEAVPTEGRLYSYVTIHKPFHPSLEDKVPYIVATVDLDCGIRILANMFDISGDDLTCGMPVTIDFIDSETYSRPVAKLKT